MLESFGLTIFGALLGIALLDLVTLLGAPFAQAHYGLVLHPTLLNISELPLLGAIICIGLIVSVIPGYRAYRLSLADGLTPRT
jgi:putative ABC transport system permease protein